MASRQPIGVSRRDILERAAACNRALSIVTNPEYREILRHLQKLWTELANEKPAVLKTHFADEILLLSHLQAEISARVAH
jgi:hypothetical protein